ncbi:hypothetical protein ACFL1R_03315 [Candidatus Latescibacterota bacterium]
MHMLKILLYAKFKQFLVILFERSKNALIRNISTAVFLGALLYASYQFFYSLIFKYVIMLEEIGYLLIERLLSVGFLAFFFMLIISSFAIALANLFRSRETEYLFSTPLPDSMLFTGKYIDIIIYSSWAILIMAMPILYSYAKTREFGTLEYVLTGFLVLFPFIIFATSLGTLLAITAILYSRRLSLKNLIIVSTILFSLLLFSVIKFAQPTQLVIPFTEDFRSLNLFINNFRLNSHPFTPNFWFIQCLRALVFHNYREFILYVSALITSAFFSLVLLYSVADRIFYKTWLVSSEQVIFRGEALSSEVVSHKGFFSKPAGSQVRSLVNKDIMMFLREPGQWAQLFLLLALLSIYFVNLHLIPDDIEIEQWRTIISVMNFGFCGFVLATLATRFVFPSISLEGDSIWVLGSAPLSVSTLFKEKFWSAFTIFLIISELIALISSFILNLEPLYHLLTIIGIFLMSIALSCLAVGFGAAFPDFSERNPSRIASSPGGILTIVSSLFYIGFMTTIVAIPSYRYTEYLTAGGSFPLQSIIIAAVSAVILNAVTIIAPLWIGANSLKKREF